MKPQKIYAGTWVPRTTLHLQEFFQFLTDGTSSLNLNEHELKKLRRKMHVEKLKYHTATIDGISATIGNNIEFNYLEDGTLLLYKDVEDLKKDFKLVTETLLSKILKPFSYLFSRGAPIPKVFTTIESILPLIITYKKASPQDIEQLFTDMGDSLTQKIRDKTTTAYFGNYLTVLVGENADNIELVRYLIFMQEHKNQLDKLLQIHRVTWDEISKIRERKKVQYKDLPIMRDLLLELKKDISFFESRLGQMDDFIRDRRHAAADLLPKTSLREHCLHELSSLISTQRYLVDLWRMTEEYADSTLNLISMLYQDNEQRELNMLQVIFIIGVIAQLITLGTLPSALIITRNPSGEIISRGTLQSFSFMSMVWFSLLALVASVGLYIGLHYVFTRLKHFRVIDTAEYRSTMKTSIKKRLSTTPHSKKNPPTTPYV